MNLAGEIILLQIQIIKKINPINVPIQTYLGPLGFTGHTAYIGLLE